MLTHREKISLVDKDAPVIPITAQANLLGISRSSIYYVPRVDPEDVKIMNALDALYTKRPYYGSRTAHLKHS